MRRTTSLICALALIVGGAFFFVRLAAHQATFGMMAVAGMVTFLGLCWLWASFINASPKPEE